MKADGGLRKLFLYVTSRDLLCLFVCLLLICFILFGKWGGVLDIWDKNICTAVLDKLDPENQIKDYQLRESFKTT